VINIIVALSILIYLAFTLWDRRRIKDEREQLIELKASELQSKITLLALVVLAIYYYFHPTMPAWVCLLAMNVSYLYSEIFGKIFWRARL